MPWLDEDLAEQGWIPLENLNSDNGVDKTDDLCQKAKWQAKFC